MTTKNGYQFNPPPGWSVPEGWVPPEGWRPDPHWPAAPEGWQFWVLHQPAVQAHQQAAVLSQSAASLGHTTKDHLPDASAPTQQAPNQQAPNQELHVGQSGVMAGDDDPPNGYERARQAELVQLRTRIAELEEMFEAISGDRLVELDDERALQDVGIYRYHHPLEDAAQFKNQLAIIQEHIKLLVKTGQAVLASDSFTFDNSLAKGRKMAGDLSKLMLRAYNAEADNCVRSLKAGNVETAKKRLERCASAVSSLGAMMEIRVNPEYHDLRVKEIEIVSDFAMRKQQDKAAEREERARLREERKAEKDFADERERLANHRSHLINAQKASEESGDTEGAVELKLKLEQLEGSIEQNEKRAANLRAGYVYVVSNAGAFGPNIVKIGMTRRLDPMDRVTELGDASVPFPFDVHALFFSEDAVTLEAELHEVFADSRVNRVNPRREFFFVTPAEVREVLSAKVGNLLEFNDAPEAVQYAQSKHYWPD